MTPRMSPKARLTTLIAVAAAAVMLSITFAAKPLYSTFCRVTGFGGTTRVAVKAPTHILDRVVRVHFDANTDAGAPLLFKPEQRRVNCPLVESERALRHLLDPTRDAVAVQRPHRVERLEHHQVERAVRNFRVGGRHERLLLLKVNRRLAVLMWPVNT